MFNDIVQINMQFIPIELLPDLKDLDEITIEANGEVFQFYVRRIKPLDDTRNDVYQLLGDTWNKMVEEIGIEPGTMCVLTKNRVNRFWLDAFSDDGRIVTDVVFKGAANLRREQLQLNREEKRKSYHIKLPYVKLMLLPITVKLNANYFKN